MIAVTLLILLYIVIFCFSAQDAESSSAASTRITKAILHVYYQMGGGGSREGAAIDAVLPLEGIIRKLAHFTEYMCVGFLSYSLMVLWYKPMWRGSLVVIAQLFLSAGLDEFHQHFIPGRYASPWDVLIDVAGGAMGMLIMAAGMMIGKLWRHAGCLRKERKRK